MTDDSSLQALRQGVGDVRRGAMGCGQAQGSRQAGRQRRAALAALHQPRIQRPTGKTDDQRRQKRQQQRRETT